MISWNAARTRVARALRRRGRAAEAPERVRLRFAGHTIWLMASSVVEHKYRVRAAEKEPWTIAWLESHVQRGEVLYDVGANVGAFSLVAALHRDASVVAFEPGFANYARLCENIHLNACGDRIIPLPWLLADRTGLLAFQYRSTEPGQSRHEMSDEAWTPGHTSGSTPYRQPMPALPLDTAIALFGLPAPHHIKLDVDGAEAKVLRGATAALRAPQLRSILVEVDQGLSDTVPRLLADAGLTLAARHARPEKPDAPWYGIFVRA